MEMEMEKQTPQMRCLCQYARTANTKFAGIEERMKPNGSSICRMDNDTVYHRLLRIGALLDPEKPEGESVLCQK
jgi:hypothetical protein